MLCDVIADMCRKTLFDPDSPGYLKLAADQIKDGIMQLDKTEKVPFADFHHAVTLLFNAHLPADPDDDAIPPLAEVEDDYSRSWRSHSDKRQAGLAAMQTVAQQWGFSSVLATVPNEYSSSASCLQD